MSSSSAGGAAEEGAAATAAAPQQAGPVVTCKGVNGLEKVVLQEVRGSSAEVYLYGGHVTSWKDEHGEELLFVSNKAIFKPPKAIRGGIPICFPQFSNFGNLEPHGFARNRTWSVEDDAPPFPVPTSNRAYVDLILKPSEEDLKIWPHSFEFRLRVALGPGGDLMLTSLVWNPWDKKAKAMPDFGDDEYKRMVCVEAAAIEKPITLKPGEEWTGKLELSAVPSSYYSGQLDPDRFKCPGGFNQLALGGLVEVYPAIQASRQHSTSTYIRVVNIVLHADWKYDGHV
uniref:Glucose-6-phosphate 1-epimerase n=1 Tax=Leersia perrieri TaxID=77586 RepID=A0A0D9WAL2_9ORYZ